MKKLNVKGKLVLNKETVTKLNQGKMSQVVGGAGGGLTIDCDATLRDTCQEGPKFTECCATASCGTGSDRNCPRD